MKEFFNKKNIYFLLRLLAINMILMFITFFLVITSSLIFYDKYGKTSEYITILMAVISIFLYQNTYFKLDIVLKSLKRI